jgi:hypothetical protein
MLLDISNKILLILLFLSILNLVRHVYYFIQAWVKSESDEPRKYILSKSSLFLLGMSIAYILTAMFNGLFLN